MKKRVIFIQGAGAGAHAEDARLVASLGRALGPNYSIHYPEPPNEDAPDFEAWKESHDRDVEAAGKGVIVVAHSAGAAMIVEWLGERAKPPDLGGIFLIGAPFFGEGGWESGDDLPVEALETKVPTGIPIHFYHGTDDEIVPYAHLALYEKAVPRAVIHRLEARDHQLNEDLAELARDIERITAPGS